MSLAAGGCDTIDRDRFMLAVITSINAPPLLLVAALVGAVAVVLLWRLPLPRLTKWLLFIAALLLVAATGDLRTALPHGGDVVVMVDLSPSTRSASYRDRAALEPRLKQLLGSRKYHLVAFAEGESAMPADAKLADLPATETTFAPSKADAVVLFSDGRFELPASAPPTYCVIDPGLIAPADVAIDDVRVEGSAADVTITGRGPQRVLSITTAQSLAVSPRETTVQRIPLQGVPPIGRAELSRGDLWPENDAQSFAPPQPPQRQQWWIGANPPEGWTPVTAESLTAEDLLTPSVIVLQNIPAADLPPAAQDRLQQYVRDLGGGLLILGGRNAFAAGGYSNTTLDALSPLASDPPTPVTHWMLLTDASGSMAAGNRWESASSTIANVVRDLPAADLVSVGGFANDLTWWATGKTVREVRNAPLPPPTAVPNGPTNLEPVLQKLAESTPADLKKELVLITDGEVTINNARAIGEAMKAKQIRLHLLAIGSGAGMVQLRIIADLTGGTYVVEPDTTRWLEGVRTLLRGSRADRYVTGGIRVSYPGPFRPTLPASTAEANRTWLKPNATLIAESSAMPITAMWRVGNGQVAATALPTLSDEQRAWLFEQIGRPPRDPRFTVDWNAANRRVIVDAADGRKMLNDLALSIELRPLRGGSTTWPLTQSAPGRYEVSVPGSTQPRLAMLRHAGREIDRRTIAGRYAREFAGIGVDEANLRELARRTNGKVIAPADTGPILPTMWRYAELTPWLCGVAVLLIGWGLLHWKRT